MADALRQGISRNDPKAMAEFYGVSQDAFERGQTWAAENLVILLAQDKDEAYSQHFGITFHPTSRSRQPGLVVTNEKQVDHGFLELELSVATQSFTRAGSLSTTSYPNNASSM